MTVGDLHHATIAVADLDTSLAFYRDALGFRAVAEIGFDDVGHATYLGLPRGASGHSIALRRGRLPAAGLTLVQIEPALEEPAHPRNLAAGTCMLAFELASPDEVEALHESLTDAGHVALSPPTWADVNGWGRVRAFAIHDPDGLLIEFYTPEERI